jgi:hypothetical protein
MAGSISLQWAEELLPLGIEGGDDYDTCIKDIIAGDSTSSSSIFRQY